MDFNKCSRCGCFFSHSGNLCPNCVSKDSAEIQKLENYLEDYSMPNSIEQLAYNTGILPQNLHRYINENDKFSKLCNINNSL